MRLFAVRFDATMMILPQVHLRKPCYDQNTVSWVFKNVVILIETIVMDVLMTLVK